MGTISQRDELSNKDKEKEKEVNLKKKEISDLQYTIGVRKGHFTNLMKDLENKKEEIKDMQKYLDEMRDRAERAEKSAEELKKEKKGRSEKTHTQMTPPVAELEKPRPLVATHEKPEQVSMIEEEESDNQGEDNTLLQTTGGGACADIEDTDHKFTEPEVPRKKRKEMKEELRKKDLEIKNRESEISSTVKTPPRGKEGVVVITITDENRNSLSNLL